MIRRALIAAVLVFPFTLMAQTTGDPFSVNLPAGFSPFTKSSQVADSKDGKITTTNWVAKSPDGQAVVVSVSKMPGKILDPAKLVNSTRDGLVKSLHATMDSEETTADTPPVTRLLLHSDAAWVRARLVVVGDTLYQLVYVGHSADQRVAPAVAQMFDTFKTL
jgi:hypothetical protein